MTSCQNSEFIVSASRVSELEVPPLPEVALLGRSNVGKSTLINRLCGRKSLAKTSGVPGKTQLLNVFKVLVEEQALHLVDLPGYGYAKLSKERRSGLHDLISDYLTQREGISSLLLLQEAKRPATEEELAIQQLAFERSLPLTIVLTKCDRLNQKERSQYCKQRASEFNLLPDDLVVAGEKQSVAPIWRRVLLHIESL
ncbi:MAG: ribosome biogenesis GTP-binding protein YsxC [Bdellovibrionales bacterium]|nr:ribosome biogenesis GTP-binding protein YsxC [Bdellovibrionales bacterium]